MGARRHSVFLIYVWLSIATVFAHAVVPLGSPVARISGSAFSASTSDVSLVPSRRGTAGKIKKQQSVGDEEFGSETGTKLDPPAGPIPAAPQSPTRLASFVLIIAADEILRLAHIPVGFQPRAPPLA